MREYSWSRLREYMFTRSYRPAILAKRARELRKQTENEDYYAPMETQKLSMTQRLENILARPFKVLFREPMLIAITVYMSVSSLPGPGVRLVFTLRGSSYMAASIFCSRPTP